MKTNGLRVKGITAWFAYLLMNYAAAVNAATGAVINVASPSQLDAALASAAGGETLRLAAGDYGEYQIADYQFSDYVTLESASEATPATFGNIEFENAAFVRLKKLFIRATSREAIGIFSASHHIQILDSELVGSTEFDRQNPSFEQVSTLYGINTGGNVHDILIAGNNAHDFKSSAYLLTSINDAVVRENICDWVAADCFKLAGVNNMLFENNFGARQIHASPTAHVDFVQGQGNVSNSVFRGNVALMATHTFQGLFFDDATFTNLVFENNLLSTSSIRGISVSSPSGAPSTGIEARYNTVLIPGGKFKASLILLPSGSISEHNIVSSSVTKNQDRFAGSNIVAQWDDPNDIAHYDDYYVNADRGVGAQLEDFRPVKGSAAEHQTGAFKRILELLNATAAGAAQAAVLQLLLLEEESIDD